MSGIDGLTNYNQPDYKVICPPPQASLNRTNKPSFGNTNEEAPTEGGSGKTLGIVAGLVLAATYGIVSMKKGKYNPFKGEWWRAAEKLSDEAQVAIKKGLDLFPQAQQTSIQKHLDTIKQQIKGLEELAAKQDLTDAQKLQKQELENLQEYASKFLTDFGTKSKDEYTQLLQKIEKELTEVDGKLAETNLSDEVKAALNLRKDILSETKKGIDELIPKAGNETAEAAAKAGSETAEAAAKAGNKTAEAAAKAGSEAAAAVAKGTQKTRSLCSFKIPEGATADEINALEKLRSKMNKEALDLDSFKVANDKLISDCNEWADARIERYPNMATSINKRRQEFIMKYKANMTDRIEMRETAIDKIKKEEVNPILIKINERTQKAARNGHKNAGVQAGPTVNNYYYYPQEPKLGFLSRTWGNFKSWAGFTDNTANATKNAAKGAKEQGQTFKPGNTAGNAAEDVAAATKGAKPDDSLRAEIQKMQDQSVDLSTLSPEIKELAESLGFKIFS